MARASCTTLRLLLLTAGLSAALSACRGLISDPGASGGVDPTGSAVPTGQLPRGAAGAINPGRVVAHRLNKIEFDNTVRDLVGLDLKPSSTFGFPDDTYIEGFDNNADALTASPLLLEKYEAAAAAIIQAAQARVVTCDPAQIGEAACANQVLTAFAGRAWRRPATAPEIAPYVALLASAKTLGDGFDQAMNAALRAMLLSPKFLFRVEANPGPGKIGALSDYELASRLSYFLWSSMPDDQLFAQAAAGALHQPGEIARQVQRMLQDPKSAALVDSLAGEWLGSRELAVEEITLPNVAFDADLRDAMGREAALFLRELLLGGHRVSELLGTDFMFVNQRLATHYALAGAPSLGTTMQRVPLPDDRRAGGILTQANFLTVQSLRDRTSPTRRGKWISENLLCVIIPPPPPQIPQLPVNDTTAPTSARDRLALHRQKGSTCNGCHQFIDPLGLGLEHYDAVGQWRDTDAGAAIDATGEVPVTNVPFDGAVSLARVLQQDARFSSCVARKLTTYATGRSLVTNAPPDAELDDTAGLGDIQARLQSGSGQLAQLLELVAASPLMTMRLGEVQP